MERICQVNSLCRVKYKNGLERQFCGSGEVCEVVGECKNFPQLFRIKLFPGAGRPLHKSKNFPWNFHIKLSPGTGRAWQFDSIYQGAQYPGKCQGMVKLDFCGIFSSDWQFWQEIPVGSDWQNIPALEDFVLIYKKREGWEPPVKLDNKSIFDFNCLSNFYLIFGNFPIIGKLVSKGSNGIVSHSSLFIDNVIFWKFCSII